MKPALILPPPNRLRQAISVLGLITLVWVVVIALIAGAIRTLEYAAAQPEVRQAISHEAARVIDRVNGELPVLSISSTSNAGITLSRTMGGNTTINLGAPISDCVRFDR